MHSEGEEMTVGAHGEVTIPAGVRERLGIEPGDELRWWIDDADGLRVEVVGRRDGIFDELEDVE